MYTMGLVEGKKVIADIDEVNKEEIPMIKTWKIRKSFYTQNSSYKKLVY